MFADPDYAVAPNGPRFVSGVAAVLGDSNNLKTKYAEMCHDCNVRV